MLACADVEGPGGFAHSRRFRWNHDRQVCFEVPVTRIIRWLKEPLLHFLVLGTALFALYRWIAPPPLNNRIVLSEALLRGLRQDHLRRNGALPTADEEQAMIQQYIDNEVLYREALAMGLDRGDVIVRRRLIQKMQFLTEGMEPLPEPTDAELQAFLDAHTARYAEPARVALTHVFVSTDRHGANAERLAIDLQAQLAAGAEPSALGDPFLRGRELPLTAERDLAGIFGPQFAAAVLTLPVGSWSAPIRSSYGLHLVRVSAHTDAHTPDLATARTSVVRDWKDAHQADADRAALARLRHRYDIRIEGTGIAAQSGDHRRVPEDADSAEGAPLDTPPKAGGYSG